MNWYKTSQNNEVQNLVNRLRSIYPQIEELNAWADKDYIELANIKIKKDERNQGIGSSVIRAFKQLAKSLNKPLVLRPEPERGKKSALDRFYKKHGFIVNRGRNKDYNLSSTFSKTMYWKP